MKHAAQAAYAGRRFIAVNSATQQKQRKLYVFHTKQHNLPLCP